MSCRYSVPALLVALLWVATPSLPAAAPPARSGAARKLLGAYAKDDPVAVAKVARPLAKKGDAEAQFVIGLFQLLGTGVPLDAVAGTEWLRKSAAQGHTMARHCLAWQHEAGFGVPKADPQAAAEWRRQAGSPALDPAYARWLVVENGTPRPNFAAAFQWIVDTAKAGDKATLFTLAQVHLANHWTAPDPAIHLYWLQQGADAGDPACLEQLSVYHTIGLLVPVDAAQGLALRKLAAAAGRPGAQLLLGQQYETGDGVARDLKLAFEWMEKAAAQDHLPAFHHLIDLWRNGRPGLAPDFKKALRLAEHGRKLGDAICIRSLADLHNRGDGVKRDTRKSAVLYREAAAKDETNAMTMLGWIHDKGETGPPDHAEARRWYAKAAALGNVRAMRELGEMSEAGRGAPVDLPAAFEWYEKSARAGDVYAQEKLGDLLLAGRGVPADAEESVNWFRVAASNTPATSLMPKIHRWPVTKLEFAVDGLIAVARETNDPWLQDNLVAAVVEQGLLLTRKGLEQKILRLLDEPDLLQTPGILPEACLAVLEANPADNELRRRAAEWLLKLQQANRPQSALLLGRHAFVGLHMPCDIPRALQWAKIASGNTAWKGSLLLAHIESVTATTPEHRATAWATVRRFAAAGDPEAALLVVDRYASGFGDAEDRAQVTSQRGFALQFARQSGLNELADRLEKGLANVAGLPTEAELAAKTAAVLAARKPGADAAPALLHRQPPLYPYALRLAQVHGKVNVEFIIDPDGRVSESRVLQSDHPLFSATALAAINQWRFVPAWKNGRAVSLRVNQLLEFNAD